LSGFQSKALHYSAALFVVFIWSITFVSTKVLLRTLSPLEILIYRYILAYLCFVIIDPKIEKFKGWREELKLALAGLLGVTLYFLCENYAIDYSTSSNVALLVVISPLITGILAHFMTKDEPLTKRFAAGCFLALTGVFLVVFNGHFILKLNPLGDLLAIAAAFVFAVYSIILKNLDKAYSPVFITRRSFFYALLFMLPLTFSQSFRWVPAALFKPGIFLNLVFLSAVASSVCFWLWNKVIWWFGAVKANNILYLVPPITAVSAFIVLDERITVFAVAGTVLVLIGVYISQS